MRFLFQKALVAALCAVTASPTAWAAAPPQAAPFYSSEKQLYEVCHLDPGPDGAPWACESYVRGVLDYILLNDLALLQTGQIQHRSWCENRKLEPDQTAKIVIEYLATRPEDENGPAAASVYRALASSFTCSQTSPPGSGPKPVTYTSGQQLYDSCRQSKFQGDYTGCDLYIMGVVDGVMLDDSTTMSIGLTYRPSWCAKSPLKIKQISNVALLYLLTHPAARDEPAAEDVYVAMASTFPCSETSPRQIAPPNS